eukprot:Em0001g3116a
MLVLWILKWHCFSFISVAVSVLPDLNDPKCSELSWKCTPLAVETYGCWGAEARETLSCLAPRLAIPMRCTKSFHLWQTQSHFGATRSIFLKPPGNYTVFQNDTPAIFYCYGNGFGTGAVVSWSLNGNGYGTPHAQMGITYVVDPPTGDTVSSHLIVPSNSTTNNNTQVVCRAADVTFSNVLTSLPANLTIQGPLDAPSNFSVNISNTSNTTFLLSWSAPFSLDVTDSPDIFYYTLCTNITIYRCRTIPSDPDCHFPRTCTSSVDFTDSSLNGTNGGQNKTIMDYDDPIHFTFFAVNGAGNGTQAVFSYLFQKGVRFA